MTIEREDLGNLTARLKLKLTPEDYTPGVEKALKEQRKQAVLPGFRPGQVPMHLIRKRVGKAVLINEVERLVDEHLRNYIQQNDLRVLGQPLPQRDHMDTNNWDEPTDLEFAFELGLAPTIDVELNGNLGVELPVVDVTDALVDQEIGDMRRRFGKLENAEVSEDKDMLIGDMIELEADGSIKEGGIFSRATISLEFLDDAATRAALAGKSVGDEVTVDPHKVSRDHDDLARMLGVDHERVHQLAGDFKFRIAEIKRMIPVEMGQELFDRVYGKDAVQDEAGFRAKVKEGLESMFRREGERLFKRMVLKKLLEQAHPELPDSFLKRWIVETSREPITAEQVEEGYAQYAEGLKRQLVEDRVLEKFGLEAKAEEIQAFAERYITDQFLQYGMPAPEGEQMQRTLARVLSDQEQVRRMRDTIVDQKLTLHFKTLLSPKESRMGHEQFVNLARSI
jgi:trigger factor